MAGTVQQLPGARELLLSPDLAPCLAIAAIVALLGLDPATPLQPWADSSSGSRAAADSSSKAGSSTAGLGGVQDDPQDDTRSSDQQPDCTMTSDHNSSSSSSPSSSAPELPGSCHCSYCSHNHGDVSLASATPLAASWFNLLGVDKQTLVTAATLAKSVGRPCMEGFMYMLGVYSDVLAYQVRWCVTQLDSPTQVVQPMSCGHAASQAGRMSACSVLCKCCLWFGVCAMLLCDAGRSSQGRNTEQ